MNIETIREALEDALDKIQSEYCSHSIESALNGRAVKTCGFCEKVVRAIAEIPIAPKD